MDQIDQIESNGLHSTKPGQMVRWSNGILLLEHSDCKASESIKWSQMDTIRLSVVKWSNGVLLYQHSGFKASESNRSNQSNGVEWTPFD